jgi:para-nitrobenzyl esterase
MLLTGCLPAVDDIEVETTYGTLIGKQTENIKKFLGVPFAKAPVGELRWKAPQPHDGWTRKRKAYFQASACVQGGFPTGAIGSTEDCLYLNVWAPATEGPHPVMVWIHGGGLLIGSANEIQYDGSTLAKKQNVIVVSMNYRLSHLGFLTLPQYEGTEEHTITGNQGFLDQIAALEWIQDNISEFGGDPDNVTVFGESAGSISTCLLLASPLTDNLLNKAIMQSGACETFKTRSIAEAEAQGLEFLKDICCDSASDPIQCALNMTSGRIDKALGVKPNELFTEEPENWAFFPSPAIDDYFLPESPNILLANSEKAGSVSIIIGTNADEGSMFVGMRKQPTSETEYIDHLNNLYGDVFTDIGEEIAGLYPFEDFCPSGEAVSQILTDSAMTCPARGIADIWSEYHDVYFYHFTQNVSPGLIGFLPLLFTNNAPDLGTCHASEIPYVLGNCGILGYVETTDQKITQNAMRSYWGNFARTGDPNGLDQDGSELYSWPRYTSDDTFYLELNSDHSDPDDDFPAGTALRQDYCEFWWDHPVSF